MDPSELKHHVYLDNHATTPMDPAVFEAMRPWLTSRYGNPGSVSHAFGQQARTAVEEARERIAACLGVAASELIFTSGATESNNLAIRGLAEQHRSSPRHFVSATTEHKAVLDPLLQVEKEGHTVSLVAPIPNGASDSGMINPDRFAAALTEQTLLASIMLVNNEMGVIQPVAEFAETCHAKGILIHTDATQAVGKIPLDVGDLDVDLMSFSGHKIYGPTGVGGLVVRRRRPRIKLKPSIVGGGQERGLRSGTANVAGIIGLCRAVEIAVEKQQDEARRLCELRDRLLTGIQDRVDGVHVNGPTDWDQRVAGNLNVCFRGVDGEALMMSMGRVAASSGSACTSANPAPSHVLLAIGLSEDETRSSLRFGIGRFNTDEDMDIAVQTVAEAVERLRSLAG